MSQIESQRKHISKTCICKEKKKNLYQELTLNLVPSAKPALQGKKLFNPSNTNASNFIFPHSTPSLCGSLTMRLKMWELHLQMQKVLAVGQSPCKSACRCSTHAQGVSDKGGPWTALSFTYTHTHKQPRTPGKARIFWLSSLRSERALPCGVWSAAREGQTTPVDTDRT